MNKLKFLFPLKDHYITQGFNGNWVKDDGTWAYLNDDGSKGIHRALDIRNKNRRKTYGQEVICSYDGEVIRVRENYQILVLHETPYGKFISMYHHLLRPLVYLGDRVKKGQVIGLCGGDPGDGIPDGGTTTGPHIHYRIMTGDTYNKYNAIDPLDNEWIEMTDDFSDVGSTWEENAIAWAVNNGVSNGERPYDNIKRVEVMEMIRKYHEGLSDL